MNGVKTINAQKKTVNTWKDIVIFRKIWKKSVYIALWKEAVNDVVMH